MLKSYYTNIKIYIRG